MKMNMQNIINVGLGIIVGFLVWQNDIQQDTIKTLMEYDQIDTDKSFDRIDALEEEFTTLKLDLERYKGIVDNVALMTVELKPVVDVNSENITTLYENAEEVVEKLNESMEISNGNMEIIEEKIVGNRKAILDLSKFVFD